MFLVDWLAKNSVEDTNIYKPLENNQQQYDPQNGQ